MITIYDLLIWLISGLLIGIVIGAAIESSRSRWINTFDRQPPIGEIVLVKTKLLQKNHIAHMRSNGQWYNDDNVCILGVEQWQPLPKK